MHTVNGVWFYYLNNQNFGYFILTSIKYPLSTVALLIDELCKEVESKNI